jgi:hypothetical protein
MRTSLPELLGKQGRLWLNPLGSSFTKNLTGQAGVGLKAAKAQGETKLIARCCRLKGKKVD